MPGHRRGCAPRAHVRSIGLFVVKAALPALLVKAFAQRASGGIMDLRCLAASLPRCLLAGIAGGMGRRPVPHRISLASALHSAPGNSAGPMASPIRRKRARHGRRAPRRQPGCALYQSQPITRHETASFSVWLRWDRRQ
jgi:hypothetical protein